MEVRMTELPIPENGWIYEKDEAATAVKNERNEHTIIRLARAYHKLRQWGKLEALASSALEEEIPPEFYRKQLTAWRKEAKDNISVASRLDDGDMEEKRLR